MKFSILALGAAVASISCVQPCSAQLNIESATPARTSEGRFVSQSSEEKYDFFGIAQPAQSSTDEAYFAEGAEVNDPESLTPAKTNESRSVLEKSLPVTTKGNQQAPLSVLSGTPEVGMVPVMWPEIGGCPTPNPVASMMTRNWCTDGLWATYPCQNARQCAHIQEHIHGHNRYAAGHSGLGCAAPGCTAPGCTAQAYNTPAYNTPGFDAHGYSAASIATAEPARVAAAAPTYSPLPNQPTLVNFPQASQPTRGKADSAKEPQQSIQASTAPSADFELSAVELPADVPMVPAGLQRSSAQPRLPSISPQPSGTTLPSMALPTSTPAVASRGFAPLR